MNASSRAWVGCSWVPSPAFRIDASIQPLAASTAGAPEALCRITTPSAPIAASVCAVSLRLSPFETLEPLALKLMTSAESRFAAASNEMRVRVESSKKRLTTVLPRRVGSFFTSRFCTSAMSSAMSSSAIASARPRSLVEQVLHGVLPSGRTDSMATRSSPSVSTRRTLIRSLRLLGRFLPTKSARMGSSR